MSDAVKVGFVAFSTAPRGALVVFCDDTLKFGPATRKALGTAANLVKRAVATNQFKGKSGSTLDLLEPVRKRMHAPSRLTVVEGGDHSLVVAKTALKALDHPPRLSQTQVACALLSRGLGGSNVGRRPTHNF